MVTTVPLSWDISEEILIFGKLHLRGHHVNSHTDREDDPFLNEEVAQ